MLGQAEQEAGAQESGASRPQRRQAAQTAGEHGKHVGCQAALSSGRKSWGAGSAQCSPVLSGKVLSLGGQDREL